MRMTQCTAVLCVIFLTTGVVYPQNCPPCLKNQNPLPGHGAAANIPSCVCPNDTRRVILVSIGGGWNVDPNGNSTPGQTNVHVWNAVNCAIATWNNAQDQFGNKTGYYFVLDQSGQYGSTDIKIQREQVASGGGFAQSVPVGTHPNVTSWKIKLDPKNGNLNNNQFRHEDLCGRVSHELGHVIGLADNWDCTTIMSGTDPITGMRPVNTIAPNDVLQVNNNLRDDTRPNCPQCYDGTTNCEGGGGGGDEGGDTGGGDDTGDGGCIDCNCHYETYYAWTNYEDGCGYKWQQVRYVCDGQIRWEGQWEYLGWSCAHY